MSNFNLFGENMRKLKLVSLVIMLSTLGFGLNQALAAQAKSDGLYLEGSIGGQFPGSLYDNHYDDEFAANISIGYKFNKYLAIEGGITLDQPFYDFAVKGILPFSNGISLFGKTGFALVADDYSFNLDPAGYFAGGVSYNFTPKIAVFAQESIVTSTGVANSNSNGTLFTMIGLNYTF
jgi:hypothetical protein